jgi:hypothetical protein
MASKLAGVIGPARHVIETGECDWPCTQYPKLCKIAQESGNESIWILKEWRCKLNGFAVSKGFGYKAWN